VGTASRRDAESGRDAAQLATWRDGRTKSAIVDFVDQVTSPGPGYVEPEARIAVFDNDGTLWVEQPLVIQLDFTIRRLAEIARHDKALQNIQPYKAAHENDLHWLSAAIVKHYHGDDSDLKLLLAAVPAAFQAVSVEAYDAKVVDFFSDAEHPSLRRPYLACGYRPMIELLGYLEANGFVNYIASGGDRDFMRPVAGQMYGVPPERVIGSAIGLTYRDGEHAGELLYKSTMDFLDDGPEKPIRIWSRIGRRPILAAGNSNGDLPMLSFAGGPDRASLRMLILHDDADREFDYLAGAEDALAAAHARDWTVVSMKDDWETVFT
jgi:phosphoglycolate phosphatase-like HAD superfamily hydrolase